MRDWWIDLVQIYPSDGKLPVGIGGVMHSLKFPVGGYAIRTQRNMEGHPVMFFPISNKMAKRFISMPHEEAIVEMDKFALELM